MRLKEFKKAPGADVLVAMSVLAVAVVLLLTPTSPVLAERNGMESGSGSQLSTEAGAGAEAAFFEGVHKKMKECEGLQHERGKFGQAQESVQNMGHCVKAIASFAQKMKEQREKSMQANKNYADDVVLAKQILKYLMKRTESHEQNFENFRNKEKQHLSEIHEMLGKDLPPVNGASMFQQNMMSGPLAQDYYRPGNPASSYMALATQQAPMMANQAMAVAMQQAPPQSAVPPPWGNMAAMFTPLGQNFQVPLGAGLVGRRPSLLQVGLSSSDSPGGQGNLGGGGLQAKLDREAEKLEESAEQDLRGGSDPDAS